MRKSNGIVKILKPKEYNSVKKIIKKSWLILAVLIITLAVLSSVFRALTPWARQYKPQVEQHLSQLLGQPVSIGRMETGWYWLEPVIKLKQVTVNGSKKPALKLDKLLVGINLFSSLWHWQIQPGMLYIDDVHLVLREKAGKWRIDGVGTSSSDVMQLTPKLIDHYIAWLALQQKLIIKNVSATVYRSEDKSIEISRFDVNAVNHSGKYQLKGDATIAQSKVKILADFNFDPYHMDRTQGRVYLQFQQIKPKQFQSFFAKNLQRFDSGQGNLKLWLDIAEGKISAAQGQINFKSLGWHTQDKQAQLIKSFAANFAWTLEKAGWDFSADQIKLRTPSLIWPENQFQIHFDSKNKKYQLYVKSIIVESLLSEAANWYEPFKKLLSMQVHGELSDTRLHYKDGQVSYVLTRFEKIGWQAEQSIPGINHLTGVVHWQPDTGHLELDSNNTLIAFKGLPAQTFSIFNGSFDWKQLSNGLRLSISRLVLSQPDLTISTRGFLDDLSKDSVDYVFLETDLSVKKLHRWLPYIPDNAFKPKLVQWLKTNLKRIEQGNGRLIIKGKPKDFPFDKTAGEFKFNSQFSGVQMKITPQWPLIKDIDGYLRFDKRDLDIDLVHADFQGIPVKEINLKIADIGHNRETLLLHGRGRGQADKLMNFIMASPLNKRLSMLNMLQLKGMLGMDLRLQLPLYKGHEPILARGWVDLDDDTVDIHHRLGDLTLEHLSGKLAFNQDGVTQSALAARAFGYPFKMSIRSLKKPQPYTQIEIENQMTVEELRKRYQLPIFELMEGEILTNSTLKLTADPNDLDSVHLKSSMQGLLIDLPPPFGKSSQSIKPLIVDVDFNPKKAIRLRMNYDEKISTDLWFDEDKGKFDLYSGEVRLGSGKALKQSQPGVRIIGSLSEFDLKAWRSSLKDLSGEHINNSLWPYLNFVDLRFNKANLLNNSFNNLTLNAFKNKRNNWSISIDQEKILADLHYQPDTNSLSGYFKRLQLTTGKGENSSIQNESKETNLEQIPALNLRIDDLKINDNNLGQFTLKSHSKDKKWFLDYGKLETPTYQMFLNAGWTQKGNKNSSNLKVRLFINNLAKTLDRFKIDPVVEANKGELEFSVNWPGRIYDFSLNNIKGNMDIKFTNGRITNLSRETEEKLGLGKLLSILSLQTIPRRLKLDFSDLSQKGYSFDIFKGHFKLAKGKMSTRDSYIDGPVAYASMKGRLDLIKRLYDLELRVAPHITASLPIVATIAGGPIAGIATWIASKIINKGMEKISGYTYKVSGPWEHPIVQQVSIVKKRAAP